MLGEHQNEEIGDQNRTGVDDDDGKCHEFSLQQQEKSCRSDHDQYEIQGCEDRPTMGRDSNRSHHSDDSEDQWQDRCVGSTLTRTHDPDQQVGKATKSDQGTDASGGSIGTPRQQVEADGTCNAGCVEDRGGHPWF